MYTYCTYSKVVALNKICEKIGWAGILDKCHSVIDDNGSIMGIRNQLAFINGTYLATNVVTLH